jgi:molybdate transport system permease protein
MTDVYRSDVFSVVGLTLRVAALSTIIIAPLATALAAISWRARANVRAVIDAVGTLPLVVPPTAVGFVLLELLSRRAPIGALLERAGIEIVFTPAAVVIASAVMSFPLMFIAARAAIDASDVRYFDIARTLGASPLRAFLTVTLPLAWRGLLGGVILAFCRAIGEFGATILVAGNIPGRTQTLALAIYDRVNSGKDEEAILLVIYVILIAVTAIVASELLIRRQQRRVAR